MISMAPVTIPLAPYHPDALRPLGLVSTPQLHQYLPPVFMENGRDKQDGEEEEGGEKFSR